MTEKSVFPTDITASETPHVSFRAIQFRSRNSWRQKPDGTFENEINSDKANSNDKSGGKLLGSVYLPLPEELANNYAISWEMNNQALIETIRDVLSSPSSGESLKSGVSGVSSILFNAFGGQNITSKTQNPRKQPIFAGIEPRNFSFSYILTPSSEKEANTIEDIKRFFVRNSLPSFEEKGNVALFNFPPEFLIKFHGVKGFPKLDSLVCTGVSIDYAPNTMQILKSGHALSHRITLNFIETTLKTQENSGI